MSSEHRRLSGAVRIAILNDDVELLENCVRMGFRVNEPMVGDDWDKPAFALHDAVLSGSKKCIKILLKLKASAEIRDEHQCRPVDLVKTDDVGKLLEKNPPEGLQELFDELVIQFNSDKVMFTDIKSLPFNGINLNSGRHQAKIFDIAEMTPEFTRCDRKKSPEI